MYQKGILPYFIIPSTFSPQASSPLEHYRKTDRQIDRQIDRQTDRQRKFFTPPLLPKFFFFSTERVGPLPAGAMQLYCAGRTMGWMAD